MILGANGEESTTSTLTDASDFFDEGGHLYDDRGNDDM